MLKIAALFLCFFTLVNARPNCGPGQINGECLQILTPFESIPQNVITVPDNCPTGQELVNGVCRDIWRTFLESFESIPQNVITVPDNCPTGQELVNGVCRDIWRRMPQSFEINPPNVIVVPDNCPQGQELINGVCRDIWRRLLEVSENYPKNVIQVPNNCPSGQALVNGVCRDIWRLLYPQSLGRVQVEVNSLPELASEINGKNIISVPSQCPAGYKPDANGICREILG